MFHQLNEQYIDDRASQINIAKTGLESFDDDANDNGGDDCDDCDHHNYHHHYHYQKHGW